MFDVLVYLIANRDRVVSKIELLDNVWGDRFVSDSAVATRIKAAGGHSMTTARPSGRFARSSGAGTSSSRR